jgi:uncharacterized protein involved in copper resistance
VADLDKAVATQLANMEKRTGKSIAELSAIVRESGLSKHGELVSMLKTKLGMGHGDANTLVHTVRKSEGGTASAEPAAPAEVLDTIYAGPRAALRPIHDTLLAAMRGFGEFEEAPKKGYVRHSCFAFAPPLASSSRSHSPLPAATPLTPMKCPTAKPRSSCC